jgi:F-box-like
MPQSIELPKTNLLYTANLPNELLIKIILFSAHDIKALLALSLVSKRWLKITNNNAIWRTVFFDRFYYLPKNNKQPSPLFFKTSYKEQIDLIHSLPNEHQNSNALKSAILKKDFKRIIAMIEAGFTIQSQLSIQEQVLKFIDEMIQLNLPAGIVYKILTKAITRLQWYSFNTNENKPALSVYCKYRCEAQVILLLDKLKQFAKPSLLQKDFYGYSVFLDICSLKNKNVLLLRALDALGSHAKHALLSLSKANWTPVHEIATNLDETIFARTLNILGDKVCLAFLQKNTSNITPLSRALRENSHVNLQLLVKTLRINSFQSHIGTNTLNKMQGYIRLNAKLSFTDKQKLLELLQFISPSSNKHPSFNPKA